MSPMPKILLGDRWKTYPLAGLLLAVIGYADYVTGYEVAFSYFYLAPVLLVAWNLPRSHGVAVSIAAALAWLANDVWLVRHPYSDPLIPYWNTLVRWAFFVTFALLARRVRELMDRESELAALKGSLVHTVSHEFNNALTVFASGLFLLKETGPGTPDGQRRKVLEVLDDTRMQMARYVKNILNDARLEAGKFRLEKARLALREVVGEIIPPVREIARSKGLSLDVTMPEAPIYVLADRDALALVVSNLLANAVKYTPEGGRVTVGLAGAGDPVEKLVFSVSDTGIGISLEEMDRLTADFYRTETGKTAAAGFGLGLKIASELLKLHGSRLDIVSEKAKGSRFSFELPAAP